MRRKSLKAFTLVELVVAMAVFSILMAGIIRLFDPINTTAKTTGATASQKTVENAIVSYIGENIRYATNLGIYSSTTSKSGSTLISSEELAVKQFFNSGSSVINVDGSIADDSTNNYKLVNVITFSSSGGSTGFQDTTGTGITYYGRLFRSLNSLSSYSYTGFSSATAANNYGASGDCSYYMALGQAFYGAGDYYLTVIPDSNGVTLKCYSTYYYTSTSKSGVKGSTTSSSGTKYTYSGNNPTVGYYELRNAGLGGLFDLGDQMSAGPSSTSTTIYFVYTTASENDLSSSLETGGTSSSGGGDYQTSADASDESTY